VTTPNGFNSQPNHQSQEQPYFPYPGGVPGQDFGIQQQYQYYDPGNQKSRAVAAILAFFLTGCGAANFYLGYKPRAFTQLGMGIGGFVLMFIGRLVSLNVHGALGLILAFWGLLLVSAIGVWALVDFIRILAKKPPMDRDVNGIPLK